MTVQFRETSVNSSLLIAWILLLSFSGCGGFGVGGNVMRLPECKLAMDAPAGWKVQRGAPGLCAQGDFTGLFLSEPMAGRSFAQTVKELSTEFGSQIISRQNMTIAGKSAEKVKINAPGGMHIFRVYMNCGDLMAYVSFAVPRDQFAAHEPSFEKALTTIRQE